MSNEIKAYMPSEHTLAEDLDLALELAERVHAYLTIIAPYSHRNVIDANALVSILRAAREKVGQ